MGKLSDALKEIKRLKGALKAADQGLNAASQFLGDNGYEWCEEHGWYYFEDPEACKCNEE
jgi:hypothetical protein